ncbi:MAG: alpha/beta hydrolase [Planctomycetaceae bacterium]
MTDVVPQKRRKVGDVVRRMLRILIATYLVIVIVFGFIQRSLLYRPHREQSLSIVDRPDLRQLFPAARDVRLTTADGVRIGGWLLQQNSLPVQNPPVRPLVLYFHGNAGHRGSRGEWYRIFFNAGADVLAIDYHGYGDSEGEMSEQALEADCDAAWNYATESLGYQPSDLLIAGTSLGGAAAVFTAAKACRNQARPRALFAIATFSSMTDVAAGLYPWLPVRSILVDRYPSEQRIGVIDCPIVLVHGDQDALVRHSLGRKLFDAAPEAARNGIQKQWLTIEGMTHHNLAESSASVVTPILQELIRQSPSDSEPAVKHVALEP